MRLCVEGFDVTGIDNMNAYYDVSLKKARLKKLEENKNFSQKEIDICDTEKLNKTFESEKPDVVINLAAQPGVRYSITNPGAYLRNNVEAFFNILECCKNHSVKKLIFASSSSVYGNNKKIPFSVNDNVDHPISFYAATKKTNELMAYTYHHLNNIPITGLRFFTVYGPYGRPDMAYYKFSSDIMKGKPIEIYNNGDMERDFTYIDDIIESIYRLVKKQPENEYRLFNIGGENPVKLLDFVETLEEKLGKKAIRVFKEMQPGDVNRTWADTSELVDYINYKPSTKIDEGLEKFVKWFKEYNNY